MRFEAKHRYFKWLATYIGNFKNVAYTMATRHQGQQCYYSNVNKEGSSSFLNRPTSVGNVTSMNVHRVTDNLNILPFPSLCSRAIKVYKVIKMNNYK